MSKQQSLKSQVIEYLLKHPIDDLAKNKYREVIKKFKIDLKTASKYWIETKAYAKIPEVHFTPKEVKKIINQDKENLSINVNVDFEIKSLEDLLAVCEVDTTKWEVVSWQCKKWDLGIKTAGEIETKELYSVSAKFQAIKLATNTILQKDVIVKELFEEAPVHELFNTYCDILHEEIKRDAGPERSLLLEIALPDVHFGKLAHKEESGEDYDLKIATARFKEAIESLLSRVNLDTVERILFPVGNDMFNVDSKNNITTGGTPQDCDTRFYKTVRMVKNLLIETINGLLSIAPVDVVIVAGNHDEQTSFMLGEMLDAYYHNMEYVNVFNTASLRKYYQYGTTSFMFTHGNKEKHADLGMIFAAENPMLWANTTQRYIQIGHLHHNRKINYLEAQEFQGFQIQIIPSISGNDAWHSGKGFNSLKQAKAFLFDRNEGKVGEFTYTVK